MTTKITILSATPRVEAIVALQNAMPECIRAAAHDVGAEGVKAMFDGYKESIDLQKMAA